MTTVSTTSGITDEMINGLSLIGKLVTLPESPQQYIVHDVEGSNWYAHLDDDGSVMLDANMTSADWITEPTALLIPVGRKIGEGFGEYSKVSQVRRGVSLDKR